jgi:hypothetical protein
MTAEKKSRQERKGEKDLAAGRWCHATALFDQVREPDNPGPTNHLLQASAGFTAA